MLARRQARRIRGFLGVFTTTRQRRHARLHVKTDSPEAFAFVSKTDDAAESLDDGRVLPLDVAVYSSQAFKSLRGLDRRRAGDGAGRGARGAPAGAHLNHRSAHCQAIHNYADLSRGRIPLFRRAVGGRR